MSHIHSCWLCCLTCTLSATVQCAVKAMVCSFASTPSLSRQWHAAVSMWFPAATAATVSSMRCILTSDSSSSTDYYLAFNRFGCLQDKREKESFFNWFYLAINVGSLIACTGIVYVQDTISWTVGFALPAAAMATAVLLFLAGSRQYRHVAPTESPMARVVKVVAAAIKNR